MKQASIKM